jgi:hypothetical protein
MVVLGPHDEVELITPPARELLASLHPAESGYTDETIATPVLALASFVRSALSGGQGSGNIVTVPGSDGWVTLHASLPGPPGDGRVAVVLERATGGRSATVRLEAPGPRSPRPSSSPRIPSRTMSRTSTRSSASPRDRSSSLASFSTSISPRSYARHR